jgi:transketolase
MLAVLYFAEHLKYDPKNPELADRDYLVVSKGHASAAVYSVLALAGFYNLEDTHTFRQLGSKFQGHIDRCRVPGVEMSTGSLGHGLSNALGMALAAKLNGTAQKTFAILSDGELQEGQNWEAIMACAHYKVANLTAIVDRNRIQLDGKTESTMALDPLDAKFKAFNWNVYEVDGHNLTELHETLTKIAEDKTNEQPSVIIANTIKGKGVSFMEDQVSWHGVAPKDEDLAKAVEEIKGNLI